MRRKEKYKKKVSRRSGQTGHSGSFTIKEAADSLGVCYYVLRQWRKEFMESKELQLTKTNKELKESEELK